MDPLDVANVFGLVLLVALPTALVAVAVPALRERVQPLLLPLSAAVAVAAMLGSLYFSERAGFVPCTLCWYQRIAMYPLAPLLTIAAIRRDRGIVPYSIVLAGIGALISGYHVYIQAFPEESNFCEILNPCSAKWVDAYGWMTIPTMAGLSFVTIVVLGVGSLLAGRTATGDGRAATDDARVDDESALLS